MTVHDRYRTFQADQREFFDALVTEEYASYFSDDWDETRRFEVFLLFSAFRPKSILDIGCGIGFHDCAMAEYSFVERVDAFDYSVESIRAAEKTYPHQKVQRFTAGIESFTPERSYDLAVSFQVFEHLADVAPYFDLCRKACAEGGQIAIVMPNRLRLSNRLRSLKGLDPELLDPQHFREYSVREAFSLMRDHGFRPVRWFGYGLHGPKVVNNLSQRQKLRLGRAFPWIAHGIIVIGERRR